MVLVLGVPEPCLEVESLHNHGRNRWEFNFNIKGSVLVDRNHCGQHFAALFLGHFVVLTAEIYDIDTSLTQNRSHWRCRISTATTEIQLAC